MTESLLPLWPTVIRRVDKVCVACKCIEKDGKTYVNLNDVLAAIIGRPVEMESPVLAQYTHLFLAANIAKSQIRGQVSALVEHLFDIDVTKFQR